MPCVPRVPVLAAEQGEAEGKAMMPPRRAVIEFARWLASDYERLETLPTYYFPEKRLIELAESWWASVRTTEEAVPVSPETVEKLKAAMGRVCPMCRGAGVVE